MSAASPATSGGASGRGNTYSEAFTAWPRLAMMGTMVRSTARLRLLLLLSTVASGAQVVSKASPRPVTASSASTKVETGRYMSVNCGMQQEVTEAGRVPA
eukprot:2015820-Rhodomonas_salina.1